MKYGYTKQTAVSFDDAVHNVKEELSREGFGILMEIDVAATLKKKLDIDVDRYCILGVCNPLFAHQALLAEKEIGLLLPCNIIVYENNGSVFVSTILPTVAMNMVENKDLEDIAQKVEAKLKHVIDSI